MNMHCVVNKIVPYERESIHIQKDSNAELKEFSHNCHHIHIISQHSLDHSEGIRTRSLRPCVKMLS